MNPIRVQFKFTQREMQETTDALGRSISPRGRTIPQWIGGGLMVIAVLAVTWQNFPPRSVALPFVLGAVLVFAPLCLSRCFVWLAWKKVRFADKQSVWTISAEQLYCEIDGIRTCFGWVKIVKVREEKRGFLLFTSPMLAHWLPLHGFSSPVAVEALRSIVRQKGIEYKVA